MSLHPLVREAAAATLCHADLQKRNIFVADHDPTIVTDLIDWQSSSIEPAFEYADRMPDFTAPVFNSASLSNQTIEEREKRAMEEADICTMVFLNSLQYLVPKLYAARALDDTLFRPFRHCHRIWKDGAVLFMQNLIDIRIRWEKLGLAGSCPYPIPTATELSVHQRALEQFRLAKELREYLNRVLRVDGWVPTDKWEKTQVEHRRIFMEIVQLLRDPRQYENPMSEADVRKLWPYDLDF